MKRTYTNHSPMHNHGTRLFFRYRDRWRLSSRVDREYSDNASISRVIADVLDHESLSSRQSAVRQILCVDRRIVSPKHHKAMSWLVRGLRADIFMYQYLKWQSLGVGTAGDMVGSLY